MKKVVVFVLLHIAVSLKAQDNLRVLSLQDFFEIVINNHPLAKQAKLLDDRAKQELRIAKGLLDPTLNSKFYNKQFQSSDYYTLFDGFLRIPTWYGIDFKAGYERNNGPYLNPENRTPDAGLSYLGVSVPLGQGLLIDERRSQIRQAHQLSTIAEAERIKIINKLLLQTAKDYWDWMYNFKKLKLYEEGLQLASLRYNAVTERVRLGDLSAIDTVEALIQVQNFQILYAQSKLEFSNSSLILSNHLWGGDNVPLEVTDKLIPSEAGSEITPLPQDSVNNLITAALTNHPEIRKLNSKLIQLSVEKRFIADKFKPKLNLEYNFLQSSFLREDVFYASDFTNNYKIGASFSYPLFLRNERGKLQSTRLKIKETDYELQQTNREIENSIKQSANDWIALSRQIELQESLVRNADALKTGEIIRFENGESSIFLVNSRESSLISNKVKLYDLIAKYAKSKTTLLWAAGNVTF
ncbi:hypothetical protein MYP_2780 [Sporocytophaga myxococcoides]|uniref:Transporter n=1 Tax=Sporocytophaga myxococcoides TaxID=153721 RepID=A0A098LF08_9BACT|nr:TolC family protein [Sporocytophaga myxococcoides]GAL85551.1 hypothetical protein MYP_2780 [Sporocytophaga myxococcoides]